jgi:CHAD domain-containing protein
MPFRLTQDESIPRGLRRIARAEIDAAVENLRVKTPAKRDAAVHEARKSLKKLRSLLRMISPVLGDSIRKENAALRNLGRSLSQMRDAAAMLETVNLIGKKYKGEPAARDLAELRSLFVKRRADARTSSETVSTAEQGIATLRGLRRRLNNWNLTADVHSMAPGVRKIYRRGRTALSKAEKNPNPENLHELRKRVKDYWYQVRLLESIWPDQGSSREKELRDVQEWLGEAHNLAVLREETTTGGLTALINDYERELREKSLVAAASLYEKKPREHTREIATLWEAWRDEPSRKTVKTATAGHSGRSVSAA